MCSEFFEALVAFFADFLRFFKLGSWLQSVQKSHFRASVKDFSLAAYFLSFVYHCLADLKSFRLVGK